MVSLLLTYFIPAYNVCRGGDVSWERIGEYAGEGRRKEVEEREKGEGRREKGEERRGEREDD